MSVTGFGVPVIRAVFMMSFKRMAFILGRDNDRLIALLFSILLISLFNPFMIFSIGTQLSYGAVLSIEYINPVVAKKLKNIRILSCIKDSIKESASVCIAVQLGVLPIIINNFEMPSLFIIAANIICAPIAEFIITTGTAMIFFKLAGAAFLAEFLAFIELIAEKLILISSGYIASLTEMGSININFMPPSAIVFYYTGILLLIFFHKKRLKFHGVTVFIITVSLIFSYFFRENYGKLEVIMLDMGQGECIYLKLPLGETCLIDCGSESTDKAAEYKINPFLKRKNVRSIKYLFITHADKDHFSGLEGILKEYVIENIVLPNINFKTENYNLIEYTAKKYNSKIIYMGKNDFIKIGDVMIECLHPYKEYDIKDTNSASIVLYVKYKEFSILFTGDLDIKGEKEINDLSLKADILKIAHHGSKTSTGKDFLENVDPKAALISCGENNKYGHPSQDVIHRLENIGSSIYITYESGAITIITDGKEKNIKKFLK